MPDRHTGSGFSQANLKIAKQGKCAHLREARLAESRAENERHMRQTLAQIKADIKSTKRSISATENLLDYTSESSENYEKVKAALARLKAELKMLEKEKSTQSKAIRDFLSSDVRPTGARAIIAGQNVERQEKQLSKLKTKADKLIKESEAIIARINAINNKIDEWQAANPPPPLDTDDPQTE